MTLNVPVLTCAYVLWDRCQTVPVFLYAIVTCEADSAPDLDN